MPSAELGACGFDGSVVLGRRGSELCERASEAGHWQEVFALITQFLVDVRTRRGHPMVRPEVAYAWHLLQRSRGRAPISTVAQRVELSARHLTTLFQREVGRSPKTVAMLMRFEHATTRIAESVRRRGSLDLAAVAAATGYSDQAHLSREFVRFTGVSPRRWIAEEFRNIQDGGHASGSDWQYDYCKSNRVADTASS
jgi:transcriptional regulator GlxA family with amidase domain